MRILHAKFVILLIESSSVVTLIEFEIKVLIGVESKQIQTSINISFTRRESSKIGVSLE